MDRITKRRTVDEVLALLAEAPDSQIDAAITPRIAALVGLPYDQIAITINTLLDECAFASLASDFAMMAMGELYNMTLEEEE